MTNPTVARERYLVSVDEYIRYHRDGFLIVKGMLPDEDTKRLQEWMQHIYTGENTQLDHLTHSPKWTTEAEKQANRLPSARLHMPHREDETAEWGLLHPRILDVLEALIGPDVLALQSMLFFNPPQKGGQGWHQDSFYIQTQPDSLIGAWIALDRADTENGCLWVAPGSHNEPIYPPIQMSNAYMHANEKQIKGLFPASAASVMDDSVNKLSEVAAKYGEAVPVVLEPGDVLFFHSHLLHRSYRNETKERFRRAYVCHYCNARSWVPWSGGNKRHVLARGRTHLPHALPQFGTPVELASESDQQGEGDNGSMMVAMPDDLMGKMQM
ncbi:phytanoyl-CoA dioxygenase family protein [Paenibacillus thalictri]|uniref:Phytanoyl-CoA dioxygenase family protein n=1 Tax=Paenibacillus thalictri TaxID=2527873 RepID=A0A4Q9DYQ8_9BACL|nr:phytanoyl-CoA dioxygenase family protein [Paenibacillus thalictri]TBL81043.1 phytanoyl-CoA dioxygenase family protein [Paenibacillus thalictri]